MQVNQTSSVEDQTSYLFKWDTTARRYFSHFELHKNSAKEGLQRIFGNVLTNWKNPIAFRNRLQYIDILTYRQLLGDISK